MGLKRLFFKKPSNYFCTIFIILVPTHLPTDYFSRSQQETDGSSELSGETIYRGVGRLKGTKRNEVPGSSNSEVSQPSLGLKRPGDRAGWPHPSESWNLERGLHSRTCSHRHEMGRKRQNILLEGQQKNHQHTHP